LAQDFVHDGWLPVLIFRVRLHQNYLRNGMVHDASKQMLSPGVATAVAARSGLLIHL
jgi:hypothetical protein